MFELKLNMYTKQKSVERKVFWQFTGKVLKIGNIKGSNTNLKLHCAFVNDQTQRILHPCEGRCQWLSIDSKYIDIAQHLTTHWTKMWDTVFPEPEEKLANFYV